MRRGLNAALCLRQCREDSGQSAVLPWRGRDATWRAATPLLHPFPSRLRPAGGASERLSDTDVWLWVAPASHTRERLFPERYSATYTVPGRRRASSTQWVDEWLGAGLRPGATNTGHFTYSPTSVCPRSRPSTTHAQPAAVEPTPRMQHVKGCLVPERNLRDTDSLMPDLALAAATRHSHAASPCPLRSCSFSLAKDVIIGQLQGASAAKLHGVRA